MKQSGLFISFEGGEGAGKSAQVKLLYERLKELGYDVLVTREPGGTRIGEQIRTITHNPTNVDLHPKTESYLMAAARAQHVAQIIEPLLKNGKIVICDRYVDSSIAYQGFGRRLGPENIEMLNELATDGARPDITILLDIPVEAGLSRRKVDAKEKDRLDMQRIDFYQRVREGFLTLAKKHPKRYVVIDATQTIKDVSDNIWKSLSGVLKNYNAKKKNS